jgi:uracil phosphoribosyltransferase
MANTPRTAYIQTTHHMRWGLHLFVVLLDLHLCPLGSVPPSHLSLDFLTPFADITMSSPSNVHVSTHPLIAHKLTLLRNKETKCDEFRRILREITFYLGYEATRNLTTEKKVVTTPMNVSFDGSRVSEKIAVIPILRAGIVMADGMLDLVPHAAVHHIGMFRSKISHLPVQYYNRLPHDEASDVAYVVDPCVATSNTLHAVVSILKRWGAGRIVVIAAVACRTGLNKLCADHPDVQVYVGALDDELNEAGMIVPGIGDAGDRQFGTPFEEEPEVLPPGDGSELACLPTNKRTRDDEPAAPTASPKGRRNAKSPKKA